MSERLEQNIYELHPGVESKDITVPKKDRLGPLRYSCEFWIKFLCKNGDQTLDDRG
jgi:hypothetical protein